MTMKKIGLTETKLFHFHRIFKNGNGEGVSSEPFLDPLLGMFWQTHSKCTGEISQKAAYLI